jgi:hypothetical protein
MSLRYNAGNLLKTAASVSAAGMLFATSCRSNEFNAVLAGLEAVAAQLDRDDPDDDITFGEWLLSELDD